MSDKKKKIYLSAPITGRNRQEREEYFAEAEDYFKSRGWRVFNPLKNGVPVDAPYWEHMKKDIAELLKCDAVFMGAGWQSSKGCLTEYAVANAACLERYTEADREGGAS